jgi:hypothetical protein
MGDLQQTPTEHELVLLLGLGSPRPDHHPRPNPSGNGTGGIPAGREVGPVGLGEEVGGALLTDKFMLDPGQIELLTSPLCQIRGSLYEGSPNWAPRPVGEVRTWTGLTVLNTGGRGYRIQDAQTWLVGLKYAGLVAGLRIRFDGSVDDCVELEGDVLFRRDRLRLHSSEADPLPLAEAIAAGVKPTKRSTSLSEVPSSRARERVQVLQGMVQRRAGESRDFHIVFTTRTVGFLGSPSAPELAHDGRENQLGVDVRQLRRLLYKGTSNEYRPAFSPIELPEIGNGQPWKLVAVFADTTVLAGWNDQESERASHESGQMHMGALLALAASAQAREVRADAYAALSHLEDSAQSLTTFQAVQQRRRTLGDLASTLRTLQLRQHLGVVTYLDLHMARPSVAAAAYYKSLARAVRLDTAAATTSSVIDRLTSAIAAESAAVSAEEQVRLNSTTEAVRGASIAAGAVALLVAAVGLFAALTAAPVPTETNTLLLRGWPAAASAAGLTVVVAAALGLSLTALTRWAAGRRGEAKLRLAMRTGVAILVAVTVTLFIVTLITASPVTLVTAVALLAFALVLYVVSENRWLE